MAVVVPIISTFDAKGIDRAIRDFKRLESGSDKAAFGLLNADKAARSLVAGLAKISAIAIGAAAVIGKNLVDAASALEESQSKVNVVFGDSVGIIEDFAAKSAVSAGISKQAALEAAGTYGNLFQAFGVGREQAANMSVTLVQLASDLASFNNTSVEDAIQALRSGLSGETEPLKRFGVALNDVRLKQEALNLGLYSGKGNLDVAAKSQAAYALILKDTALAQGDFARTSDGAANQQRILAAQFQNIRAEIGTALLPVFKAMLSFINESILPVLQQFANLLGERGAGAAFKFLGQSVLNFTSNLGPMGTAILAVAGALVTLRAAAVAYTVAANAAKLANIAFGVSFAATPFGLIAAAIAAVIAIIVILSVRFEGFRKVAIAAINVVIKAFELLVNAIIGVVNSFIAWNNVFLKVFRFFGANLKDVTLLSTVSFGKIGDAAEDAGGRANIALSRFDVAETARFRRRIAQYQEEKKQQEETFTGGAAKVKTAAEMLKEYTAALRGVTSQQKDLTEASAATAEAQRALGNATEGVRVAQAQFNLVTQGYPRESKKAQEATRALEDANRRLRDSNLSQADALRRVTQAEQALAALRAIKADPEAVAKAERNLSRSKFDVEEAAFRVAEAEKELADLRGSPEASAVEIRRAEIALEEAKFRVAEATLGVKDAEGALAAERNKSATAEELAEAERDLDAAKRGVEDAIRDQKDATVEQAAAQAYLNEVLNGAKEGSDAYRAALDDLNEAKKREQEAIDAVAEAFERERDALLSLIEAQKELNALKRQTPSEIISRAEDRIAAQQGAALPSQVAAAAAAAAQAAAAAAAALLSPLGFGPVAEFASGGIVTRPTIGLVGEAGPEAIIPLRDAAGMGAIHITVNAGMGANGPEIGDAIVEALRKWQFRNGALVGAAQPLKVA
jgi:hypothetical protein